MCARASEREPRLRLPRAADDLARGRHWRGWCTRWASVATGSEPMTNPRGLEGGAGRGKERLPEAELGGADAVEKTTYVVGDGTDPEARPSGPYIARGAATSGPSVTLW